MTDRERVREEIAKHVWALTRLRRKAPKWEYLEEFQKDIIRNQAEEILAIKGLVVVDEDAELPKCRLYDYEMIMEHDCPLLRERLEKGGD